MLSFSSSRANWKIAPTTNREYEEYQQVRFSLVNAWNTNYKKQLDNAGISTPIITPFRAVYNAGDLLCRKDYVCQKNGTCTQSVYYNQEQLNTSVPAGSGNSKYVYDSSTYTKFRKHQAILKGYNTVSQH